MKTELSDPSRAEFYQGHLDRVSRSFAFCIARLDGALRERVGLSYLLCRLLDTIEDADWSTFALQERAFLRFDSFVTSRPRTAEVADWAREFPFSLPEGEALLLKDSERILTDFHELPEEVREPLGRLILSMSAGMRHFMCRKAEDGQLTLKTAADVNRYCFFVAGVVGEMLTQFAVKGFTARLTRLSDAFRFGLFLQKVNLLKDQRGDEKLGRFLVPSRPQLLSSLLADADGAFRYLLSLSEKERGFRLFCAWSLFLGLASLPWIQRAELDEALKIPREETLKLLSDIEETIDDCKALGRLFEELKLKSAAAPATHRVGAVADETESRRSRFIVEICRRKRSCGFSRPRANA